MIFQLTKLRLTTDHGATHCLEGYDESRIVRTLDDHYEPRRAYLWLPADDVEEAKRRLMLEDMAE